MSVVKIDRPELVLIIKEMRKVQKLSDIDCSMAMKCHRSLLNIHSISFTFIWGCTCLLISVLLIFKVRNYLFYCAEHVEWEVSMQKTCKGSTRMEITGVKS